MLIRLIFVIGTMTTRARSATKPLLEPKKASPMDAEEGTSVAVRRPRRVPVKTPLSTTFYNIDT